MVVYLSLLDRAIKVESIKVREAKAQAAIEKARAESSANAPHHAADSSKYDDYDDEINTTLGAMRPKKRWMDIGKNRRYSKRGNRKARYKQPRRGRCRPTHING